MQHDDPLHDGGRDHTPQDDAGTPDHAGATPWPQPASEDGRGVPLSLLDFLA